MKNGQKKRRNRRGTGPPPEDPPSGRGRREDQEAAAASSPHRSSSYQQVIEPAPPPQVQRSTKCSSVIQEVPLTPPAWQHSSSKSRSMLGKLKVSGVKPITPKDGGEVWYQAIFSVLLKKKRVQFKQRNVISLGMQDGDELHATNDQATGDAASN